MALLYDAAVIQEIDTTRSHLCPVVMVVKPWNAGDERGVSPLQLLEEWLTTRDADASEDNCTRWFNSDELVRKAMCDEILSLFEAKGIRDRTKHGIVIKIGKMKAAVSDARQILLTNGFTDTTNLDGCSEKTKTEVLKRCPNFERLAPVMTSFWHSRDAGGPISKKKLPKVKNKLRKATSATMGANDLTRDLDDAKQDVGKRKRARLISGDTFGDESLCHVEQIHALDLENKRHQNEHEESNRKIERLVRKARAKKELLDLGMLDEQVERELQRI